MTQILCLSTSDIRKVLTFEGVMRAVERAFIAHSSRVGRTFPIIREQLSSQSTFGVKAGYLTDVQVLGLKAAGYWRNNRDVNEEAHQATIVLLDPATGKPRSFLDGNYVTTIRTGAAGAVAIQRFSKEDSTVLALIGTGVQGHIQTEAALEVRPQLRKIQCYGSTANSVQRYLECFQDRIEIEICDSLEETLRNADIIVTATPTTTPLVKLAYLKPGVHINAIGSDTRGKSEIDLDVLQEATIFVDDLMQSKSIGELQKCPSCRAVEIGSVLMGSELGRQNDQEITLFDSTGIALQDLETAELAVELALQRGLGTVLYW